MGESAASIMADDDDLGIDVAALAAPLPGDQPAGESLRYEGTYDRIREDAREDDPNLPQGVWQTSLKRADWGAVRDGCLDALATRSKDLQIAAWLLEALIHLHGFAGAVAGLRVLRTLSETFWDTCYPEIEDDDLDFRLAPFHWVNEKLPLTVRLVPLTEPASGDALPYRYADWDDALRRENLALMPKGDRRGEDEDKVTRARFMTSVALTPKPVLQDAMQRARAAEQEAAALEAWLDQRCGPAAPSLLQFRAALNESAQLVASFLKDRGEPVPEPTPTPEDSTMDDSPPPDKAGKTAETAPAPTASGPITDRDDAYRRLAEAAEYLLQTEPHSPTPYLVKRAVAWGSMSLDQLLQELIQDKSDLAQLLRLLGMPQRFGDD